MEMAPQQNSTLIDDNLDTCPSLLNLPESPILPPKHQHQHQNQDRNNKNSNNNNNKNYSYKKALAYNKQTTNAYEERLVDADPTVPRLWKSKQAAVSGSGRQAASAAGSRRHRSVSLYGINSTVEQGLKEIPIWLDDDEPRYVSGVTNKTTCNDIIKALIDDELRNGNAQIYNNNNNNNNINNKQGHFLFTPKQDGGRGYGAAAAAASRDYGDYVITESWRGIERSYDGNMAILPVWRAWSRVHNELRLSLKQRSELKEPPLMLLPQDEPASFSLFKWLKKLFHLTKKQAKQTTKVPMKTKEKCLLSNELVIMPDQLYMEAAPKQSAKAKLYKLAETRVTQRQRRRRRSRREQAQPAANNSQLNNNNNNCIRRRRKDAPLRSSLRNKLAAMHAEMNVRYEREYALTRQLSEKCKLYRLQNERYTTEEMELSVGQLQHNIEAHAEDIIKTEHELLELKNEIKQDISLINNLKRMTLEETATQQQTQQQQQKKVTHIAKSIENAHEMQFVDNIYEFCDNNASMLV